MDVVHPGELLVRRFARRDDLAAVRTPAGSDRVHHLRALGPFRVPRGRLVFSKARVRDENQRHGEILVRSVRL
jgi:hypothetical protein